MARITTLSSIPTIAASYGIKSKLADRISLWQGDITTLQVDGIVNAANNTLLGGGGVDGAIHRAAGPDLLKECRKLQGCDTGDAKVTRGYQLPSSYVIHTVGPIYTASKKEQSEKDLRSAYTRCLEEAVKNNIESVAFPSISTGVYGYPITDATGIALRAVSDALSNPASDKISRVVFVTFSSKDLQVYERMVPQLLSP